MSALAGVRVAGATEAGFDEHVVKPVDPARLASLLARADSPGGPQADCPHQTLAPEPSLSRPGRLRNTRRANGRG